MTSHGTFDFATWPPKLSDEQRDILTTDASIYALAHGLLRLPAEYPSHSPAPQAAIHAPISLLPAPFPRNLFISAKKLQRTYNILYARVAMDTAFLDKVMGADKGIGRADSYIGTLWRGWKRLRDENKLPQPLHFGLFRSDYLLHMPEGEAPQIKQVEVNTVAAAGAFLQRVAELHRHQAAATNGYFGCSPYLKLENFPSNECIAELANGLAAAHNAYLEQGGSPDSEILFIAEPGEINIFDQTCLEYELLERHGIRALRQTTEELITSASITSSSTLIISTAASPSGTTEISVAYFRSGLVPYPAPAYYDTRFLIERSRAIKCPTIALHLAGGKKVQEVLGRAGVVERFLPEFSAEEIAELRGTFMDMWSLGEDTKDAVGDVEADAGGEPLGTSRARSECQSLVLKPERDGGGNNVYKEDIPAFLDSLSPDEREAWVAMRLIESPKGVRAWFLQAGSVSDDGSAQDGHQAFEAEVVSELGIYGWALFGNEKGDIKESEAGWMVRTKRADSDEGGVTVGHSVLDSLVLV